MVKHPFKLLALARFPARLNADQAAPILGFAQHDIPVLVKAKLLKPLGNPAPNAVKYFSALEIESCAQNQAWLERASPTTYQHWANQNKQRRGATPGAGPEHLPAA